MTQIYADGDITIERHTASDYFLSCRGMQLQWRSNVVSDQNGCEVVSFRPREPMWWDVKLLCGESVPIGTCTQASGQVPPITVHGMNPQRLFLGEAHILDRNGNTLERGPDFEVGHVAHMAMLLVVAVYHDQAG